MISKSLRPLIIAAALGVGLTGCANDTDTVATGVGASGVSTEGSPTTRTSPATSAATRQAIALPAGFVGRDAGGPFEPTALPQGFAADDRVKIKPAGPNPVTNYLFVRDAPAGSLTINVFEYVPSGFPNRERVSGVRPVDIFVTESEERGTTLISASWTEGGYLVSAGGFGLSRAEFLDVVKLLRAA